MRRASGIALGAVLVTSASSDCVTAECHDLLQAVYRKHLRAVCLRIGAACPIDSDADCVRTFRRVPSARFIWFGVIAFVNFQRALLTGSGTGTPPCMKEVGACAKNDLF
jgi:hypothetical protein